MTCEEIERDDIAEQYVLGRLGDEASAHFEAHYFDCPQCLGLVERLESARSALATVGAAPRVARSPRRWWQAAGGLATATGGLAAAAVLLLAVWMFRAPPPSSAFPEPSETGADIAPPGAARTVDLQALGAIEPPPFTPPRLRSSASGSRAAFLVAMETYTRGDYVGAIPGLERAVRAEPEFPAARFFLGVAYLQLDRRPEAIEHLREVARRGESPYLEDAHFFLAKASIRNGDIETARSELRTVIALGGERLDEASRLLMELQ